MSEEPESSASAAKPAAKEGRKWSLTATLAIAGSVVAVAAGGVGLLFKVDPAAEPCLGGASARFIDAPVFPVSRTEYHDVSGLPGYGQYPSRVGAEVRSTVEVDNLRGKEIYLYYTLLDAGARGAADRVVTGNDEFETIGQVATSCTWRGGFDTFAEPETRALVPISLDPRKSYRIVLELFEGEREGFGGNRLALFETPVFRG
ncbi:MAG TPA: hypothetical protein VKB43_08625 [Gaiellaceae bacterium]|nr:hypothetical protein [Gaiellaceae bacterium]